MAYFPHVSIIAMKGPPFTRKTEFATEIAKFLKCPVLSTEHSLSVLQPDFLQASNTNSTPSPQDLAFHTIFDMAVHHLWNEVAKNIVIDSSLSSAKHLRQLIKLASFLSEKKARVVIVECKPKNTVSWQMKFEEHLKRDPDWSEEWYRPKNWEDMKNVIKHKDDEDENHKLVSKIVLDPLLDLPGLCTPYEEDQRLQKAIDYMITRRQGDGPKVVIFNQWQRIQPKYRFDLSTLEDNNGETASAKSSKKRLFCHDGAHNHCVHRVVEGPEYEDKCIACLKQMTVGEVLYTCKDCRFALHEECAESFDRNKITTWESLVITAESCFVETTSYNFPEKFACSSCKGREFASDLDDCAACLFETHLRCHLMPSVIKHVDAEEHLLFILLPPIGYHASYRCAVCGESDEYNLYLCQICSVAYHYQCLIKWPRRIKQEHGGHHHYMSLTFCSEEAEEYLCDECLEGRDPDMWIYSCEECVFVVHLDCVHNTSSFIPVV